MNCANGSAPQIGKVATQPQDVCKFRDNIPVQRKAELLHEIRAFMRTKGIIGWATYGCIEARPTSWPPAHVSALSFRLNSTALFGCHASHRGSEYDSEPNFDCGDCTSFGVWSCRCSHDFAPVAQVQFDPASTSFTAEEVMYDLQAIMGKYATPASLQVADLLLSWGKGKLGCFSCLSSALETRVKTVNCAVSSAQFVDNINGVTTTHMHQSQDISESARAVDPVWAPSA